MQSQRIAAIDFGSNSFLLTIVDAGIDGITTLHESSVITQLSKGMSADLRIPPEAITRSLSVVEQFHKILGDYGVGVLLPVGTAVFRKAANARDFLNEAEMILGTEIEVVSGQREAELSYLSVSQDPVFKQTPDLCVVDLGGGSAEIASQVDGKLSQNSYPIGAIAMKQMHTPHDPIRNDEVAAITTTVTTEVAANENRSRSLVGVGGAYVNFCGGILGELELARIHGMKLTSLQLDDLTTKLCSYTDAQRAQIPGMEPQRAGIIHISAIIASQLLRSLKVSECQVSVKGMRWGVIYEACHAHRN